MSNKIEALINKACDNFNIKKSNFTDRKRLKIEQLYIVVAVYFILREKYIVKDIQKYIIKNRVTFRYYDEIIRNEFNKLSKIIEKLK